VDNRDKGWVKNLQFSWEEKADEIRIEHTHFEEGLMLRSRVLQLGGLRLNDFGSQLDVFGCADQLAWDFCKAQGKEFVSEAHASGQEMVAKTYYVNRGTCHKKIGFNTSEVILLQGQCKGSDALHEGAAASRGTARRSHGLSGRP
jgi:hypothetical protein